MEQYFSISQPKLLTHMIFRKTDFKGRKNLVQPQEFLQVAALDLEDGEEFKPHVHIWKPLEIVKTVAQEAWVVIEGTIETELLDSDSNVLTLTNLNVEGI
jgi:hypothetical protein